jgi:protein disulfide-isomerase A1
LAPEYVKAAEILLKEDPPLRIAKVDATEERDLAEKFGIKGFPTLKFFKNGKDSEYDGGRTSDAIVSWLRKKTGPPAKTLDTVEVAKTFIDNNDVAVVLFHSGVETDEYKSFMNMASVTESDVQFAVASADEKFMGEFGIAHAPALVLFKQFDEKRNDYTGDLTSEMDMSDFINSNSLPLVIPFNQNTARKIFGGPIKSHLLLFTNDNTYEQTFSSVAESFRGRMLAITVDQSDAENEKVCQFFGLEGGSPATLMIVNMEQQPLKKFRYPGDLTVEGMVAFGEEVLSGKLKPFLKSEPEPEENNEPVVTLVGTSFERIVLDAEKDVLVEFYAPWCGHCKSLAPKYEELAKIFVDIPTVVIAKMDATENEVDHPDVNIRGFPTIKFFPAGENKEVVEFDGARDVEDFVKFIKAHAKSFFDLPEDAAGVEPNDEL